MTRNCFDRAKDCIARLSDKNGGFHISFHQPTKDRECYNPPISQNNQL